MSCFLKSIHDSSIEIPSFKEIDNIVYYEIKIKVKEICWFVSRRYNEFYELHEKLVTDRSVSKDLLPPKKVIGNKNYVFLEKRRNLLEIYLKDVFIFLQLKMPREFVEFLDFHKYDVIFLLQGLANTFFMFGDNQLSNSRNYVFSILELYAISERLKLPCPEKQYDCEKQYDFSHVLDFCSQLNMLTISESKCQSDDITKTNDYQTTSHGNLNKINNSSITLPIGKSNIIPNQLNFELSAFKNLKFLIIYELSTENIYHTGTLRKTLETFSVHKTNIDQLNKIILCDDIHKSEIKINDREKIWNKLKEANFSLNGLQSIDHSINLLTNINKLILDHNQIKTIENLNKLSTLCSLSLCENKIKQCNDLHLELGNLIYLNLSQNQLTSLYGLRKMYSLVNLDVSCNLIENVDEVDNIAHLPCLENLRLTGNPVATTVDYRSRVLSRFDNRSSEICLDNEKGSQQEIDTALVLSALRISSEKKKNNISPHGTAINKIKR